jgi:two-component system, LytTR family, sensor kinase
MDKHNNGTPSVLVLTTERDGQRATSARSLQLASGRELSTSALFWLLHNAGWITLAGLAIAADIIVIGIWGAVLENTAWAAIGWAVALGLRIFYRQVRRTRKSYAAFALAGLLSSVAAGPLWYAATEVLIRGGYHYLSHFASVAPLVAAPARTHSLQPWWIPAPYWFFYTSMLLTWSSLYFGINAMLDLEAEKAKVARALKLADTAHLRALQSNLNPHFLFNALNGIGTLVREGDAASASAMVDALGVLLRSTLQRVNTAEITVSEELQLIEEYLRIQRFRFGLRLRSNIEVKPATLDALIPTLILQPLVENAVRHGVLPREAGGSLWISIRKEAETLVVSVEDDGPGLKDPANNSMGHGLENSRDRLAALYGGTALLMVGPRAAGGFAAVIRMPFRRTPDTPAPESLLALST